MQFTGQTSTHDLSFTPMQGSAMTNGIPSSVSVGWAVARARDPHENMTRESRTCAASKARTAPGRAAARALVRAHVEPRAERRYYACRAEASRSHRLHLRPSGRCPHRLARGRGRALSQLL